MKKRKYPHHDKLLIRKSKRGSDPFSRGTPIASGTRSSVNGTFTGLGGGTNYYMVIYRDGNDGHYIEGFGTLTNQ